ncbi:MAG: adenylate/guanylate cyclase domain-containing protein, partial [Dehalococcoidia bacterium]
VDARVIAEKQGAVEEYSFTHALIRETLYEELRTARRLRLHRQIGEVLEELHRDNMEPHLAELAHHFSESVQGGDVDKAIDYATRAGGRATALTAYEDAAGHYQMALQALEARDKPDEAQRCELLLALGDAENSAGDRDGAKETFLQAADIARTLKDSERLSRAALGFAGLFGQWGMVDERVIGLLEEAADALGEEDSALRALLLSRLGMELWMSGSPEPADLPSSQSVEVARRVGDPKALADALTIRYLVLGGPEHVEDRLAAGTEIVRLAEESGARERGIFGHYFCIVALLEMGDLQEGYDEIDAYIQLAKELRQPHYLGWATLYQGTRAVMEGRFDDAERLNQEASSWVDRAQEPLLAQLHRWQMMGLRRQQGRLKEIETDLKEDVEANAAAWLQWDLVCLFSETGRKAEARAEFERWTAHDFADVPRDGQWLTAICLSSRACASVDDARRAAILYDLLLPHAGRNAVGQGFTEYVGSTSHYLGLLAATLERWEDAERHFDDALEMNAGMGARPLVAHTQHDYADMLLARDDSGDRQKALELVTQALDTAQELGMRALFEKALALKLSAQGIDPAATQTSIDAVLESVHDARPDLPPKAVAPDGTVTILFTDIEGSSAMTERLGDQRWLEVLRQHNAIVRKRVAVHEGFEVKAEGDGFMLAFGSARKALECAVEIQRAIAEWNTARPSTGSGRADEVRVRIGLHTGEALKEADAQTGR